MKKLLLLLFLFTAFGAFSQTDPEEDNVEIDITDEDMEKMEAAIEAMFAGSDIDIQDQYNFDFEYQILMIDYNSYKGETKQNITMRFNEKENLMGMEMYEDTDTETYVGVIFNYDTKEAITMTEQNGIKMGFAMKIPNLSQISSDDEEGMPSFEPTGDTETIAGFVCNIKQAVDGDKVYTIWVAENKDALPREAFTAFSEMNGKTNVDKMMGDNNCILKMKEESKESGTKSIFEVTSIKGNSKSTISTSGFDFSSLKGLGE